MELLAGGVALPRITYLVKEHGVDFSLTQRLERAFVDAGAHTDLISALQQAAAPFVTSDSFLPPRGVVARIGSGAAWPFGGLAYSLTIARDSGLPNSAIRFNTLHPIIASLFCDS